MSTPNQLPTREEVWKQLSLHVDLYRHYLDLTLKFNAFYYALTGAIVSFYLSRTQPGVLRFSLLLPIVLGYSLAVICAWGAFLNLNTRRFFIFASQQLGFGVWPEIRVLSVILWVSAVVFFLVATALTVVLCLGGVR